MHADSVAITSATHQLDMALEAKSSRQKCGICCIPIAARGVLDCCSDIFCFSCIDTWSSFTSLCPLCKLQFKFITFVPVAEDEDSSDVDTQEAFFDFLGQERVESWIDDCEEDGTLSFPSYFIEEDAVVCLDGDGCRVRKGLTEEDGQSGLEDTSVACDACDCWYHAFCVGYRPDSHGERSWICPRCVGTGVLDLFKFQPPTKNLTSKISSKSMSLDKDGPFTFVDEGETAVVVSMDGSFRSVSDCTAEGASTRALGFLSENKLDDTFVKAAEDTEERCAGASMAAADSSLKDTGIAASDVALLHSENTADVQVNNQKSAGKEEVEKSSHEVALVKSSQGPDVKEGEPALLLSSTDDAATITSITDAETSCEVYKEEVPTDSSSRAEQKVVGADKVLESMDQGCKGELGVDQENAHRKQEARSDIRREQSLSKKREPPHCVSEKQKREKKKLKSEDRVLVPGKQPLKNLRDTLSEDVSPQIQMPDKNSIKAEFIDKMPAKQDLIDPVLDEVMRDQYSDYKSNAVEMEEVLKPKSEVMVDLKDLVKGIAPSRKRVILPHTNSHMGSNGTGEGVRTGKIIYRGSIQHGKTSKIMNEIHQHLKQEAVNLGITGDHGKVDVLDEKFFVAFKAAVQSSQASMAPVKRLPLQKPGSKRDASRQSLMKKLYGGTGKRRQAWDRDWDISFWRERVSSEKRARQSSRALLQKEMAYMEEAIQNSKEEKKAELDSLRSRVYLADTSLLPRQVDIKPLSEQSSHKTSSLTVSPPSIVKTGQRVSKHLPSAEDSGVAAHDSSVLYKTDKRKWALEVLARKTGQQENLAKNGASLLAELPQHMRPVIEYDRRSKVPSATRQIQLDRFIEFFLQKAPIELVNDSPECQAAVSSAVTKEKEIYVKSNSKVVYVNLCVQTLSSLSKIDASKVEEALSPEAGEPSLFSTVEPLSPLATAEVLQNEDGAVLMAWKATGLISDSPPASPQHDGPKSLCGEPPSTITGFKEGNGRGGSSSGAFDMDSSFQASECLSGENLQISCHEPTEAQPEISCRNEMESNELTVEHENFSYCTDKQIEKNQGGDESHEVLPQIVSSEEDIQQKGADCVHHDSLLGTPSEDGTLAPTKISNGRTSPKEKEATQEKADDHEAHCSSIDIPVRRRQSANPQGVNRETVTTDDMHVCESIEKITKQVESYVKSHIRPLHRSNVITRDQYVWAVSKTTNKVMQHHTGAKSADFLISEGEKVRRLAEQYLQLYHEHMLHGTN